MPNRRTFFQQSAAVLSALPRTQVEAAFGPEWAEVLVVLREVREATFSSLPSFQERAARWAAALDLDEAASLVREGRAEDLRARLTTRLLDGAPAP